MATGNDGGRGSDRRGKCDRAGSLKGRRIVVTRPAEKSAALIECLERLGATAVHVPVLEIAPPRDWGPLDAALRRLDAYDWVVFASTNAVKFAFDRHADLGLDPGAWRRAKLAAVGDATERALRERGAEASLVPERTDAEGLVEELAREGVAGKAVLLPQAREGRPALEAGLRRAGANVTRVDAYESRMHRLPHRLVRERLGAGWDGVTFASPSAVRHFTQVAAGAGCDATAAPAFCIGESTAREARELGYTVGGVAARAAVAELAAIVAAHFERYTH